MLLVSSSVRWLRGSAIRSSSSCSWPSFGNRLNLSMFRFRRMSVYEFGCMNRIDRNGNQRGLLFRSFSNRIDPVHTTEIIQQHNHHPPKTEHEPFIMMQGSLSDVVTDKNNSLSYQTKVKQLEQALATLQQSRLNDTNHHHGSTRMIQQQTSTTDSILDQPHTQAMLQVASAYTELGMFPDALNMLHQILHFVLQTNHINNNKNNNNLMSSETHSSRSRNETDHPQHLVRLVDTLPSSSSLPQQLPVASLLHSIGATYFHLNHVQKAQQWLEMSLQLKQTILDSQGTFIYHSEMGKTLNALAILHLQSLSLNKTVGEEDEWIEEPFPQKALSLLQQAEMHYRFHGMNHSKQQVDEEEIGTPTCHHPQLATVLENMATLYRNYNQIPKALQLYQQVLEIRMSWISSHVLNTEGDEIIALTCLDIGDLLLALDQWDEAAEKYEQALKYHTLFVKKENYERNENKKKEDDDDVQEDKSTTTPGTAMQSVLLFNLGKIHAERGRFDEAMQYYQQALEIRKALVGESSPHPEVAMVLNSMGALLATQGNRDGVGDTNHYFYTALAYFREAHWMYQNCGADEAEEMVDQTRRNIQRVQQLLHGSPRIE